MINTQTREISNTDDIIDVRDVIARVGELEGLRDDPDEEFDYGADEGQQLLTLTELLDDLRGKGGDEEWRGDWYPATLIRDDYFADYARQLAEDIGAINGEADWPNNHIDWEGAARELRIDYTTTEFDGEMFWYRLSVTDYD